MNQVVKQVENVNRLKQTRRTAEDFVVDIALLGVAHHQRLEGSVGKPCGVGRLEASIERAGSDVQTGEEHAVHLLGLVRGRHRTQDGLGVEALARGGPMVAALGHGALDRCAEIERVDRVRLVRARVAGNH